MPCMTRNKSTHIKTINRPFPCEVAFPDTMRKRDAIDAIDHVFGLKKGHSGLESEGLAQFVTI